MICPTTIVKLDGLTATDATGAGLTVTVAAPLCGSLAAVTTALPSARAVTSPVSSTVATDSSSLVQVIARPARTPPVESLVVAVS